MKSMIRQAAVAAAFLVAGALGRAEAADQIAVAQYGITSGGWPYAIALEKGFFKEEGLDISGVISSQGGGTSLRNMLSGGVVFGEVNPGAVVVANQQGAKLTIIGESTLSVADLVWVAKPGSPIKSIKDIKGKKIGYTNPRSTTQALAFLMLQAAGLKESDVELVKTGGFGEGLTAVEAGLIDLAPVGEPLLAQFRNKFQIAIEGRDVLPLLANVVTVTTEDGLKRPDFLKAVLRGRAKAVRWMYANPDEAAVIVAKSHNMPVEIAKLSVKNLVEFKQNGMP